MNDFHTFTTQDDNDDDPPLTWRDIAPVREVPSRSHKNNGCGLVALIALIAFYVIFVSVM